MTLLPPPPARRPLGQSGVFVSPMAWGMWRLTRDGRTLQDAERLVHGSLDAGITLLDTADIYGWNGTGGFGDAEAMLGCILAAEPSLRARMVVATKGGIRPPFPYDQSADYLRAAIDASLKRLQTDVIDVWQVHRPDLLAHPAEVARVLDDAVDAGKIRCLGVSNFTQAQTAALNHFLTHKLVTTQPELSALRIDPLQNGDMDQAMMLGLTPLAWSPLGGGRLLKPATEREQAVADAMAAQAAAKGVSITVAAYSWLMAHPAGIIPIIGSQQVARIAEGVAAQSVRWTRQEWYDVLIAARGARLP